jgi:hypothetical protein
VSAAEHTAHGDDPAAAEDLTTVVRDLTDRIEALQADVRRLGAPGLPAAEEGWDAASDAAAAPPSYAWVSSIPAPVRRRPSVPRLLLEILFLAGVAIACGVAKLDAPVIAGVMVGAWVLVALIEWAGSRAERRRDMVPGFYAGEAPPAPAPADPSWFVPPVEQTLIEPSADSPTAVTRLPPPLETTSDDLEATVERRPGGAG